MNQVPCRVMVKLSPVLTRLRGGEPYSEEGKEEAEVADDREGDMELGA